LFDRVITSQIVDSPTGRHQSPFLWRGAASHSRISSCLIVIRRLSAVLTNGRQSPASQVWKIFLKNRRRRPSAHYRIVAIAYSALPRILAEECRLQTERGCGIHRLRQYNCTPIGEIEERSDIHRSQSRETALTHFGRAGCATCSDVFRDDPCKIRGDRSEVRKIRNTRGVIFT
jgi:hypothetical protein